MGKIKTNYISLFESIEPRNKSTDWKWNTSDYPSEKKGINVFSCFACGGGSTMGYKLAGCNVIGCVEIDKKMNELYVANHNPKYNFLMDIREFNKLPDSEIPIELFNLDILDGSPPCTTFSIAGQREESWGIKKKFHEGQAEQTLDDLPFVFIETVKKLHPRVVIMENVEGIIMGNAWKYIQDIYSKFHEAGYQLYHWLMKSENMGIPQTRHRVFFIAICNELCMNPRFLNMAFDYEPVTYGAIKENDNRPMNQDSILYGVAKQAISSDSSIARTRERIGVKASGFNNVYVRDNEIMPTLRAKGDMIDVESLTYVGIKTMINSQTFPQDYYFGINPSPSKVAYILGMSVPPIMIKRIVERLIEQGVFNYKMNGEEQNDE